MSVKTNRSSINSFITRDGSRIRELMHPQQHAQACGVARQSLAEARIAVGNKTHLHRHHNTEELYHITAGQGLMTLGNDCFTVTDGDTICIQPGTPHCIENTGDDELVLLCCCAPAYSHDDTELL